MDPNEHNSESEEELAPQDSIEDIKSQSSQLADEVAAVEVDDEEADEDGQDDEDDEETEEVQENGEVVTVKATKEKITQLPIARVKKMIKYGDPEWKGGTQDAQLMIVYAAERFLEQLADRVWEQKVRQTVRKTIKLTDVTAYLDSESKYDYLEGALTGKSGCLHGLTK